MVHIPCIKYKCSQPRNLKQIIGEECTLDFSFFCSVSRGFRKLDIFHSNSIQSGPLLKALGFIKQELYITLTKEGL